MSIQHILVPVDYSNCSRESLRFAVGLAQKLQASLDVVHVWDRPSYVSDALLVTHPDRSSGSLVDFIRNNAQRDMDQFLKETELPSGFTVVGRLIEGDPASSLLKELKSSNHDLVVVGTHGRTGLSRLLLGSVAEKLNRLSPVPVLTVPSSEARSLVRD